MLDTLKVKLNFYTNFGFGSCTAEFPKTVLARSESERKRLIYDYLTEWARNQGKRLTKIELFTGKIIYN